MIARKYLIPLRKEFLGIRSRGKFYSSESFTVIVAKNDYDYPRFAIIVGKKIFKLSVTRHRVKRLIAEALKSLKLSGNDYVYLARKPAIDKTVLELIDEIAHLIPH